MASSSDLAEERTDWAEDRTILANERTFSAWIRTGLASIGVAIALHAVFAPTEPTWLPKLAASIFVVVAMAIFLAARLNAGTTIKRLNAHAAEPVARVHLTIISIFMIVGAGVTLAVLWLI